MNGTPFQLKAMRLYRRQLLDSPDGRAVLEHVLTGFGFFRPVATIRTDFAQNGPATAERILVGLSLLENLGVWTMENAARLIEKMAELPLPELENTRGET